MKTINGNGFTLIIPEPIGKIEIRKISKMVSGQSAVLTITPTDEFFERAFGHKPKAKEKIQFQIVCSLEYVDIITKGVGIPITEDPDVSSQRSRVG